MGNAVSIYREDGSLHRATQGFRVDEPVASSWITLRFVVGISLPQEPV